jgi:hypothetical protein
MKKFENNEKEVIYVVLINTTMDKINDNYAYITGVFDDRETEDISEANHYDSYDEALKIITSHEFTKGTGNLWGAQLYILKIEKKYYIDENDENKIDYLEIEIERELICEF